MTEKRFYKRFDCKIKLKFEYYVGNPDTIKVETEIAHKGKGLILDISQGGVFIITNEKVQINMPINLSFSFKKEKYSLSGKIIRTGNAHNNPSDVLKKFSLKLLKKDNYIAVRFDEAITSILGIE